MKPRDILKGAGVGLLGIAGSVHADEVPAICRMKAFVDVHSQLKQWVSPPEASLDTPICYWIF